LQKDRSFCKARISARCGLRPPLLSTSPASPGDLSAFQLFVGVLRDQSFREAL
jgi:hypothetical protein